MKEKKTILICDNCGAPMIYTFMFRGAEKYCLMCGCSGGLFGTGKEVNITTKLEAQNKVIKEMFDVLAKYRLPLCNFYQNECEKCYKRNEYHWKHVTEEERFCHNIADEILNKIAAFRNECEVKNENRT